MEAGAFRLRAKRCGVTSTKLEERSRAAPRLAVATNRLCEQTSFSSGRWSEELRQATQSVWFSARSSRSATPSRLAQWRK